MSASATSFARAGGLTSAAYVKGAHVIRQMTPEEVRLRDETLRLATGMQTDGDSISMPKLNLPTTYSVAIELDKALAMPGSDADLVMKEGDVLDIPEYTNTVRISGDVMFPNTVTYKPGKKIKYYVEQAGGYGERAKKSKAFIIYMNGEVALAKGNTPIEPGCQIVVPSKHKGQGVNWTAILSSVSALGSVATMTAALANLFK